MKADTNHCTIYHFHCGKKGKNSGIMVVRIANDAIETMEYQLKTFPNKYKELNPECIGDVDMWEARFTRGPPKRWDGENEWPPRPIEFKKEAESWGRICIYAAATGFGLALALGLLYRTFFV